MKRIYKNNDLAFNLTVNNYPINKDLIDSIEFKFYSTNPNNCIIKTQDDIDIHNQIILQWNELQYLEKGVMYYDCTVRLTDSTMNDGKLDTVTKIMTNYYICSGIDELDSEYSNYYTKEEVNQLLDSVTSGEVNLTNYYTKSETNTMLKDYVEEDVLGSYYTKNEVNDLIDRIDIPVTDLSNYYKKAETYSKTEVNNLIDGLSTGDGEINLNNYYTKEEVDSKIPTDYIKSIPSEYITETELNKSLSGYSKSSHTHNYLSSIPSEYITETELNAKGYLTQHQSLANYYTKGEVNNLIDGLSTGDGEVNLTNYYTKDEVNNLIPKDYLTEIPSEFITESELSKSLSGYAKLTDIPTDYIKSIPSEYITETELNAKGYLTQHQSLTNYYTKSEVDSKIPTDYITGNDLGKYITEDELNDMNFATKSELPSEYDDTSIVNRITALETELTGVSEQITELNNMVV